MPPLVPPIVPVAQLDYVDECIEAVLSLLRADPNTKVGGNLGVATIEREYPQPDGAPRAYPRAALPALAVSALSDTSSWVLTHTRSLPVSLRVTCTDEGAATRSVSEDIRRLLENVQNVIQEAVTVYTGTFLPSDAGVLQNGTAERGAIVQLEQWPFRFHGDVTIPIQVIHSSY